MRAWEMDGFGLDRLRLVERPEPTPGPGQVLVKMSAWSLNYRDLMVVKGQYNPRLKFPFTPLSDGVGEIVALGAGITSLTVGQRVAGCFMQGWIDGPSSEAKAKTALGGAIPGVAAELVALEGDGVVAIPEHLSDAEGAALPCAGVTAWNAVMTSGRASPRDVVLIQGTGGVSIFALQFAKLAGAGVIGLSSRADKIARAQKLGLDAAVNYRETPEWGDKVRELAGGIGVDHVVEVGGAGTLAQSFRAVRMGGRISLIGVLTGNSETINPLPILMRNLCVQGIFVGSREMFEAMNRAIASAKMTPVVDRVFRFDELPAALAYQESGAHFGKVCMATTSNV